jgi:hypothetical protein
MKTFNLEDMLLEQQQQRDLVLSNSSRGLSALALAKWALDEGGDAGLAAAALLLSMELEKAFDFRLLLKLDSTNRAHADLIMQGYKPHQLWPSQWIGEVGGDASLIKRVEEEYSNVLGY